MLVGHVANAIELATRKWREPYDSLVAKFNNLPILKSSVSLYFVVLLFAFAPLFVCRYRISLFIFLTACLCCACVCVCVCVSV